jgi:hypothetical protein
MNGPEKFWAFQVIRAVYLLHCEVKPYHQIRIVVQMLFYFTHHGV